MKNTYFNSKMLPLTYNYQGRKSILQRLLNPDYEQMLLVDLQEYFDDDYSYFDKIQVLVISPDDQEINEIILYALADTVSSLLGNDYATVYDGSVVTVCQKQKMTGSCMEQIKQCAKDSNSKIGISWFFSGKEQVRLHYKQALMSIEMAKKMRLPGDIFSFDEMYVLARIKNCSKQAYWANHEHPVLVRLKEYDTKHNSFLYDTLHCLLKCGMSSTLAAKKLAIHKSTMSHRVEALEDLIPDLSMKSAEWQASVMLSSDLARLKNEEQEP